MKSNSIAIMQPYFFPYGGYFSLAAAADTFVFYDDVNFIKRGWINRNILCNNIAMTVPLQKASINKKINQIKVMEDQTWRRKLLNSLTHCYRKEPFFEATYTLVESVVQAEHSSIADMAIDSIIKTCKHLSLNCQWEVASKQYNHTDQHKGQERLQIISKEKKCLHYYNLAGGKDLYLKEDFSNNGITLEFISNKEMKKISIIDYLMRFSAQENNKLISNYEVT